MIDRIINTQQVVLEELDTGRKFTVHVQRLKRINLMDFHRSGRNIIHVRGKFDQAAGSSIWSGETAGPEGLEAREGAALARRRVVVQEGAGGQQDRKIGQFHQ